MAQICYVFGKNQNIKSKKTAIIRIVEVALSDKFWR
jgi:hypothetical protein